MKVAAVATVAFWVLISIGGAANWQYKQYQEFLSSLAADGVPHPEWAITALVLLAISHALLVPGLAKWHPGVAAAVAVAALALVFVTVFRISCPGGARYCTPEPASPSADVFHGAAVLLYTMAVVSALMLAATQHRAAPVKRVRGIAVVVVAVVGTLACGHALLTLDGLAQRIWLLAAQIGLLLAASAASGEMARRERLATKERLADAVPAALVEAT